MIFDEVDKDLDEDTTEEDNPYVGEDYDYVELEDAPAEYDDDSEDDVDD